MPVVFVQLIRDPKGAIEVALRAAGAGVTFGEVPSFYSAGEDERGVFSRCPLGVSSKTKRTGVIAALILIVAPGGARFDPRRQGGSV